MSTPKQIKVPTVLLDAVCKVTLKKSKKQNTPYVQLRIKKPVIYKMISTEEWLKKEEAKKAKEARIKEIRERPKTDGAINQALSRKPRKPRNYKIKKSYQQDYYFRNKERLQAYQKEYHLKLKKAKNNPFNEPLQTG
jgi:hypothetical protein